MSIPLQVFYPVALLPPVPPPSHLLDAGLRIDATRGRLTQPMVAVNSEYVWVPEGTSSSAFEAGGYAAYVELDTKIIKWLAESLRVDMFFASQHRDRVLDPSTNTRTRIQNIYITPI